MTPRRAPSVSKAPILREMPLGAPCRQLGDVEQDAPVDANPIRENLLCAVGWHCTKTRRRSPDVAVVRSSTIVCLDCDLGMLLARLGYSVEIADTTTWEEATSKVGNWVGQRSRWIKGYMQTYFNHMRNPWKLYRELGFFNFLSFQLTVGTTWLCLLVNPWMWALTITYFVTRSEFIESLFPWPVLLAGSICLWIGNPFFVINNVVGAIRGEVFHNAKWSLTAPLWYNPLMSWAAYKALFRIGIQASGLVSHPARARSRHAHRREIRLSWFTKGYYY